ncbi:transmembrane O-mannosyltransferase targeting cadherins 4 [Arctopsyche grandis]|uniref:transmembrane O-mannosyltransferase targeting cadherins 4 n=1 Tax=Arctopsyche grandis TaxID=121162 RepID=UPI00406D70B6
MHVQAKIILIIYFSVIPYIFFLDGDFVFDDSEAILKNRDLNLNEPFSQVFYNDFWGSDIKSKSSHKSYRPLTVLTFRLNKQLDNGTLNPFHFKITNLILHTAVTILLYQFVWRIYARDESFPNKSIWKDVPFLSSILFAVHPVHTEAVSGIVGRADLLAAIFFFLSVFFYDKSIPDNVYNKSTLLCSIYFIMSIVLAIFATLSKETGITVLVNPFNVIKYTYFETTRVFKNGKAISYEDNSSNKVSKKNSHVSVIKNYTEFTLRISLLLISMILILYGRWAVMNYEGPKFQDVDNPAAFDKSRLIRVFTYNYIYFINLLILIWPQWLCFDWSMGCVPVLGASYDLRIIFVILFWICFAVTLLKIFINNFYYNNKRPHILALCIIVIPFLPAANILMPVGFVVAERILYIPSAGFCILIAQGVNNILSDSNSKYHKIFKVTFILFVCIMILRTMQRNRDWLTEKTLYLSGVDVCPLNAKVHYNIAKNSGDKSDFLFAEKEYIEAIRLNPSYFQAMNNLANLLKDQTRFSEAETYLRNALEIKEDFPAAWMNLGIVLAGLKQPLKSEHAYREALKYRKNYADCYYNLGNLYLDQNKNELAFEAWSEATRINPKHAMAWSNTLALLDNTGQINRGLKLAREVMLLLPEVPAIHFNIANIYGKIGDFTTAEKHFKEAISLKGDNVPAIYYANFGVLYHRWKKPDRAIEMYQRALSINPTLRSAINNIKKLTVPK